MNYKLIFAGTPFAQWYSSGSFRKSRWVEYNLVNAFRFAILYQRGGTYFDLDTSSVRPFTGRSRILAKQSDDQISVGVLSFPPGDPFVWDIMQDFVTRWNGYLW